MTRRANKKSRCDQGGYRVVRGGIEPPTSRFSVGSGPFVRMRASACMLVRRLQSCMWMRVGADSRQSDGCQGLQVVQEFVELLVADLSRAQDAPEHPSLQLPVPAALGSRGAPACAG
jgi:hypothetical protein